MDVAFLLYKYFKGAQKVSIDVFDAQTLDTVYKDVISAMTSHFEIEVSVLQALSYCLYEMMDNVHIHSGKPLGTAMTHYDEAHKTLSILIADDGIGIQASLSENEAYKNITEAEALKMCLEDKITDGKGLGFGLFTISRLVDNIGEEFILHSGMHKLIRKDGNESVIENGFWQGTLIYMVIGTGVEIDPNQIVDHRTDVEEEYNESFIDTEELDSLWFDSRGQSLSDTVIFEFLNYGTDFGTRDMGQKLRQKLLALINGDKKVILDFTGVKVVSNSFADECLAKLLLEIPLDELKCHTAFRGLNSLAERSVLVALQRRYKVISETI